MMLLDASDLVRFDVDDERGSEMAATIACNVGERRVEYKASSRPVGMYMRPYRK